MKQKITFYKLISCLVISCFFITSLVEAEINNDLHSFFNKLGDFDSNVTTPTVHSGQEAGYYTGGSLYARTKVRDVQLMQIDLPSYRSGCGGIDLFMGGISFIKAGQLVELFKNIMNNAVGYAFTLAMEAATPQLANVMKYLQEQAAKINSMNVNSCETAAALVGSVWPRTQEAQRRVCADVGNNDSIFHDYAEAKQGCGNAGKVSSTLKKAKGAKKNTVFSEGNLAWLAIKKNSFLSSDHDLADLFMSLSGTIIVRKKEQGKDSDDNENTFVALPSLATNVKLLGALLNGGEATIYKCNDDTECLIPTTKSVTIKQNKSLKKTVSNTLQAMASKFIADSKIKPHEIGLMEATTLPIQKMLNVQAAFYKDKTVLDISNYADIIAIDILFQYLNDCLNIVRSSTVILQYPEEIMSKFIASVDAARKALRSEQRSIYAELTTTTSIIKQTKMIEDALSSSFSENMNMTMKWAKGDI